jgi:hypothetical protein
MATSREQLRASRRFAEYESLLSSPTRSQLDTALTTMWYPLEIAREHYAAIDRLALTEPEIIRMTDEVAEKLSGAFMQTMSSMLRTTLTPWDILPFYARVWRRLFVGGALAVAKNGPKDAHITIAANPLLKHRYLRIGLSRHLVIGIQFLVAKRAYVRELTVDPVAGRADYLLQWV